MENSRRFDIASIVIVLLAVVATVYLTKDFLSTILLSIVLVFLLKPMYSALYRFTRHNQLSSFFSIMIVFIVILAVLLGLTSVLLVEVRRLEMSGALAGIQFSNLSEDLDLWMMSNLPKEVSQYVIEIGDIPAAIASWATPIAEVELSSFASNLPILFAQSIVVVFFTYYILMDGAYIVERFVDLLPKIRRGMVRHFFQELNAIYTTLFTVYFTTSLLSGVLAAIGFFLLGIPYPLVLGTLVALFTLIPLVGPPVVFVPMALYYFFNGDYSMSLVLIIFGVVALMVIPENVIRPHLALKSARIHPIITVIAYTAPIFVLGIMGVIVGPTLYGFLLAVYRTVVHYRQI